MPRFIPVIACIAALTAGDAQARMYQWSNPGSGVVQLSGSPPAWYRSARNGPRVLVFDNGQLIDDTALTVTEALRQSLRAEAFGETELAATEPAEPPAQTQLREALATAADDGLDVRGIAQAFATEREAAEEVTKGTVEQTVAELKSLLDAWDTRRIDEMKGLLRDAGPATAPVEPRPAPAASTGTGQATNP